MHETIPTTPRRRILARQLAIAVAEEQSGTAVTAVTNYIVRTTHPCPDWKSDDKDER